MPRRGRSAITNSYLGNSWRANLVSELQALTKQLADQGLAKPDLIVTNSNGDINLELTQLKAQVAQGCDLIMSYPGSATGLCSGIKEAFDKGVLVVTIDSTVTCPKRSTSPPTRITAASSSGKWISEKIGGKGNVVVMNGQPGTANTVAQQQGFLNALKAYPNVRVDRRPLRHVDRLRRQDRDAEIPRDPSTAGRRGYSRPAIWASASARRWSSRADRLR